MDVTKNTDGLAAVMGHEIAHAVAKHSVERASQAMTINLGTTVADIFFSIPTFWFGCGFDIAASAKAAFRRRARLGR